MVINIVKFELFSRVSRLNPSQHIRNILLGSAADCEILSSDVDADKQEQKTQLRSSIFASKESIIQKFRENNLF